DRSVQALRIEVQADNVQRNALPYGTEFNSADQLDAIAGRQPCLCKAVEIVVIGYRQQINALLDGSGDKVRWPQRAVGGGAVTVKIGIDIGFAWHSRFLAASIAISARGQHGHENPRERELARRTPPAAA